uniref:Uncharacterized protein n=1 Tax=Anguilla anguilla TaxID=7936 RepID=A0A0E9SF45_ANGAN
MLEVNGQLRDNLNKAQLDIQALQSMIGESNQELEELRGKLRDYIMNMSSKVRPDKHSAALLL